MSSYTIYGDRISGNCLKVKWTADYLGANYEWRDVSVVDQQTRMDSYLKINPAGQVPAIVLPSGQTLAQSNAIIVFLNRAFNGDLLPPDEYLHAKVFEWLFWEQYSHEPAIAVRRFQKAYLQKPDNAIDPALM
ncbi:MAG: glutathione S-transferase N-terminal domain-containing protein, partial [Pseudomonadota bacterium]